MSLTDKRVDVPSVVRPGVTYHLRKPDLGERSSFKAAITSVGGQQPNKYALVDLMEQGVEAIYEAGADKEDRDRAVATIKEYRKNLADALKNFEAAGPEKKDKDNQDFVDAIQGSVAFRELQQIMFKHYKPFADLVGEQTVFTEKVGLVACRMFLVGWSGLNEPFSRKLGIVQDEVLEPIGSRDFAAIGEQMFATLEPSKAQLGNSPSAAGGSADQTASSEASTAPQKSRTKAAAGTATS